MFLKKQTTLLILAGILAMPMVSTAAETPETASESAVFSGGGEPAFSSYKRRVVARGVAEYSFSLCSLWPACGWSSCYFKNLFEKLGIKADMLQMGDYKGAAEPYSRDNMSPEFRSRWKRDRRLLRAIVETVAADRKLDAAKVKELIDEGLFTAQRAKEVGLIDRVAYGDEFRQQLVQEQHVDPKRGGRLRQEENGRGGFLRVGRLHEIVRTALRHRAAHAGRSRRSP